jgi:hypothetical protein
VQHVDPKTLREDERGYRVYTFVALASDETQRRIEAVRDAVRVQRTMIPAHVTVRGGVGNVTDYDAMRSAVRTVCGAKAPFDIAVVGLEHWGATSVLICEESDLLKAFHMVLVNALAPLTVSGYSFTGDNNRAHLTVFSDPAEDLEEARRLAGELVDIPPVPVNEVQMWGHAGVPYVGRWDFVESFTLVG